MRRASYSIYQVFLLCVVFLPSNSILIAQDTYKSLAPGLDYRHEARADGPLSIHAVRIDRQGSDWDIQTGLGQGTVFGLEPLNDIVVRTAASLGKSPCAAINGDFFVMQPGPYQGDPRGIQIIDGELVSRPTGNAFWVAADGTLNIGHVGSKLKLVWPDGRTETAIGLNEARADDAIVLFTPTLAIRIGEEPKEPPGTRTQGGKELVLERVEGKPWLPIVVGTSYSGRVAEIQDGGNTPVSRDRMILSIGSKTLPTMPPIRLGDTLQLVMQTEPDLQGVKTAIGAGRILVQDGRVPDVGPANQPRHPRSIIGWDRQHLHFIVIDGRQPDVSVGMTYPEMAALAKEYGCANAIELDGGGSSTLWAMGQTRNSPSDGKARAIANGLIVFRTDQPAFDITTKKPADQVEAKAEKDTVIFDVFSPSGISGATITLTKGRWPSTVVLRLHLSGLESFAVANAKTKLTGSVLSHSGETKRLYLTEDGEDLEPGTEIKVFDANGKPIQGMPSEGGYFEIKLPSLLLQSKTLTIDWIDFFRG